MIRRVQRVLQWLFMRAEALFNAAFGDRLNPFYHLGEITFTLFWLVAVSGLYLYAFFKTGVAAAYGSVEALTHGQWYLGGVMRSVHRYASDGMVLIMGIHMLRHFAFDRLRGFRWFSWMTGTALIWLVTVAGINGYMLPWDKLAQFVIVAAFELLDWLPSFNGALVRNFIYQSSVNDRFFSLLSFIHLGLPLLVLLLMFIHVQRVPKARTSAPRPIAAAVLLVLLVLALVKPALSQGGAANLGVTVTTLDLDWFFLAAFPLFYILPLGRVWALLVAGTALLAALPWLPPKFRRDGQRQFQMTTHPDGRSIVVRPGETLLEAGLREGLGMPFECRSGACGRCRCTVLNGRVDHGIYQNSALPDARRELGEALMCCAVPLSDLEIEYQAQDGLLSAGVFGATVVGMERLCDDVMQLVLALPSGEKIDFTAGQYLNILLEDGQRRAFSFANPPHQGGGRIELHIRLIPGGLYTTQVFTRMRIGDQIRFEGPLGSFRLSESERPIIFVAGATGFAPIKSIVEDAFQRGIRRPMRLYWGARRKRDLYLSATAETWQREHENFTYIPVLSEAAMEDHWSGRTGWVHQAIVDDLPDLSDCEAYVCGSVNMVEAAFPALLAGGLAEDRCFSDAFRLSAGSPSSGDGVCSNG
ncbi:CDP-6-deoxy-L-threo-D-glycero-4-hexulose-3-dehydrase reductase [mine drainage metagenome]|uniref:CDP-6-deoxy-L-threo-D-glycero-4-hexulose-3-dehydrase reductase n=1 Tax=mine drainage metagenome TaxID=410659 RepID=A0A1J5RJL1_9ZZZZ